jgi:DNA polymerase-3 subunit gamma/tau
MRELRENVRYRPARDRYKIFIVDEAHQITSEAFNALLKTLEEPPEWVVFILCTTEVHKIPTTIASRCQQFSFRSVDFAEVVTRMAFICEQEGIEAGDEVLAVLAQAGEGSVRDSLSALDQAIACCGDKLDPAEVRNLLGMFSLDSLNQITQALSQSNSRQVLEVVLELDRNGRNLQHFCRELARYFRNLLVAKVAGANTRLIAASPSEQEHLASIAKAFSEEDLTRYLQIMLDTFKELQTSIQPRLHLEIGLLKLVHAGRMGTVEEALANLGGSSEPPPKPPPPRKPTPTPAPITSAAPLVAAPPPAASTGPWRDRLHSKLTELGLTFTADAIEHSQVSEVNGELQFLTPEDFSLAMDQKDISKAVELLAGRPMRLKITVGDSGGAAVQPMVKPKDDVSERALAHPEVRRFQELFPDAQVRAVRNLKE